MNMSKVRVTHNLVCFSLTVPSGAYVRYLVGADKYRIYEIHRASHLAFWSSAELLLEVQPHNKRYKVNDNVTCDVVLELKYGSSIDVFPMDKVSNVDFSEVSRYQKGDLDVLLICNKGGARSL